MPNGCAAVRTVVIAVVLAALAAACSGGGGAASADTSGGDACSLVRKLDDIVAGVPTDTLADPAAFRKALDTAVNQYAATVRRLRSTVPADLHGDLDRVEADVKQYRFSDALTHRSSLDAYATRTCARPRTSTSTGAVTTSTAVP